MRTLSSHGTSCKLPSWVAHPSFRTFVSRILFSRDMSSSYEGNLVCMLDIFRKKIISAYGGNMKQVPTTFSITRLEASNFDHIPIQFGVSAPLKRKKKKKSQSRSSQMADLVRSYRVRQCWGELEPPQKSEAWKHGQCAENQSLSSVVAQCAELGLKNVTINTLAMKKSGKLVGMCGNCRSYVSHCVLRRHPTWKVVDGYTIRKSSQTFRRTTYCTAFDDKFFFCNRYIF